MNSMSVFNAIGFIDDKYVMEAKDYKKNKLPKTVKKIACFSMVLAVCLIVCICLYTKTGPIYESNSIITEKKSDKNIIDNKLPKDQNEEKATTNEAMDNLNMYFSEHEIPDWFGGYYLENNNVYIGLADLNTNNKLQVQTWAKSKDIIFKKVQFSYNYLSDVTLNISNAIKTSQITFIHSICIDSRLNRIEVNTKYEIADKERNILYSYDKEGGGSVFNINISSAAAMQTQSKPLKDNDPHISMKIRINKKHMLKVKIRNRSNKKISFGAEYKLYKKENKTWVNINSLPNISFIDIAYYLEKNDVYSDKFNPEKIFGSLDAGKYKLEKEISSHKGKLSVSSKFLIK